MTIQYEARVLLFAFTTGVGLMVVYDILRVFRILVPHRSIYIGLEDICYWVYAALITFALLYKEQDGGIRGYVIVGVFSGMLLYDRLVSRFFIKSLKKTLKYFKMKLYKGKVGGG